VFVDISEDDLNIDPGAIRSAITKNTGAILGTHCYGNPCDVLEIEEISKNYNLPVIYDGCHAFGARHLGQSLLNYGDFTVVSFHATKVFNTFEGGAVISKTAEGKRLVDDLKNFGIQSELHVTEIGLNGKMSEFNAAVGIAQLPYMARIIHKRAELDMRYRVKLSHLSEVKCLGQLASDEPNYPYFPIMIGRNSRVSRDDIVERMRAQGVNPRRYFYPLITNLDAYEEHKIIGSLKYPNAESASSSIICLPLYPDLSISEQDIVIGSLIDSLKK
jgi:dTDP-4-amino-4,6-dideoxygalactose transaminase